MFRGPPTSQFFIRTWRAAMTAFSGGSISVESLAISTAIFAAPYAILQVDSLDDPDPSRAVSEALHDGEAIAKAIALDEALSALRSLVLGWNVASSFFMYSKIGGVGGGLFVGVDGDDGFLRKGRMIGARKACPLQVTSVGGCGLDVMARESRLTLRQTSNDRSPTPSINLSSGAI
jgi:hypothetical protein